VKNSYNSTKLRLMSLTLRSMNHICKSFYQPTQSRFHKSSFRDRSYN